MPHLLLKTDRVSLCSYYVNMCIKPLEQKHEVVLECVSPVYIYLHINETIATGIAHVHGKSYNIRAENRNTMSIVSLSLANEAHAVALVNRS